MLLERIGHGVFVTANKLDFCYTNWEFPYELFASLTNKPTEKLKLKFIIQKLKVKRQRLEVKSWKLKVKSWKSKVKS